MTFIKRTLAVILTVVSIQIDAGSSLTSVVDFYGHPLILTYDQQLSQIKFYKYDQREIERQLSHHRNSALKNAAYGVLRHAETTD